MTPTPDKDRAALADEREAIVKIIENNPPWTAIAKADAILALRTPSGHSGRAVLQQLELAHSEMNYGTARNRLDSVINDLRCASSPNPAAGDGVREALAMADRAEACLRGSPPFVSQNDVLCDCIKLFRALASAPLPQVAGEPVAWLKNLDELDKQRTPGPWKKIHDNITAQDRALDLIARCDADWNSFKVDMARAPKNARFIVALENAWPKLRAMVAAPLPSGRDAVDPVTVEALEKLIQRHASAYVARGSAISDSIIAECKASRDALLAALSQVPASTPATVEGNRPRDFLAWAVDMFGPAAKLRSERLLRFIEEAIELAHAEGMERVVLGLLVQRVYSRPQGETPKEIGQAQACLETFAENIGLSSASEAQREWERVQGIPRDEWTRRHAAKQAIGIALSQVPASTPVTVEGETGK